MLFWCSIFYLLMICIILNQFWSMEEIGHIWRDWDAIIVVILDNNYSKRLWDMIDKTTRHVNGLFLPVQWSRKSFYLILSIYLSIYLSMYLSIYLSINPLYNGLDFIILNRGWTTALVQTVVEIVVASAIATFLASKILI